MGFIVTSIYFATPTDYVKSSEDANFPASWVGDHTHPYRPWRATDTGLGTSGSSYVGLKFSAATTLAALVIDNINLTSVIVEHSADGASWSSDGTCAVSWNIQSNRYKAYVPLTGWHYQYIRVRANSYATDSTSTMQVGSLLALTTQDAWTANPGFPSSVMPMRATLPGDDFLAGGREPIEVGNPYARVTLSFPGIAAGNILQLQKLASTYTKALPLVYYRNNSDTSDVYICRRVADIDMQQVGPNHYSAQSVILEECV